MRPVHDRASDLLVTSSKARPGDVQSGVVQGIRSDPLSDALEVVRLTGALFFLVDASSPWGVEVPHARAFSPIILPRAQHVVSYHIVLAGRGWASIPGESTWFEAGDVLVFPHGDAYSMLSAPQQPPEFDADATIAFFRDMVAGKLPFVIHEGGGGPQRAQFVCGFLGCDARPFNPVLSTLPRLLRVRRAAGGGDDILSRLIGLTLEESRTPRAGGESIRLRLSELIFVEVVRRHLESLPARETGWLSGLRDPHVGRALALLHESPARFWTVRELSELVGMSRAAFAARFTHLVRYSPMRYLALWRMQMAARLLSDGSKTVAAVGLEVGYDSEAAFSRAFKKIVGISPANWREQASL